MGKFVHNFMLTEDDKRQVSEMSGKIMLWILEGRDIGYMSKNLNLPPWQIEYNIDEMLYDLRKHVGLKRFIKTIFFK